MVRILSFFALAATIVGCGITEPRLSAFDEKTMAQTARQDSTSQTSGEKKSDARDVSLQAGRPDPAQQVSVNAKTKPEEIFCPSGSWYSSSEKMCVTDTQALGPFTRAMIDLCKKYGGGNDACEGTRWERKFAARLRLSERCPRGALYDETRQACVENQDVHGPFKMREVEECRRRGGGQTCESMRWNISFIPVRVSGGQANRALLEFYGKRNNYDNVYREVLKFYPTGRRNGCVAFMSTALRMSGTPVPLSAYIDGESVSLVTKPFATYLIERMSWTKITSANNLQPGDVVMTEDDARWPGYPAHTYMFYGWSNQKAGIGWVIDNQDFIHERNIFGYGTYNFTPFAYALRSPQ